MTMWGPKAFTQQWFVPLICIVWFVNAASTLHFTPAI